MNLENISIKRTFMFKKIEIWILYLVVLLGIPVTIGFGSVVRHEILGGTKLGRISETSLFFAEIPSKIKVLLENKSDLEVQDRYPLLDGFNGTPNSSESYLLLSRFDGNLEEGIVELVDLTNFNVLHTWNPDINRFNRLVEKKNIFKFLQRDANDSRAILRHPFLLDSGELIFTTGGILRKINACSNLISQPSTSLLHHSIEKDFDGNLWVPSHIYPQSFALRNINKSVPSQGGYFDDGILKLSQQGEVIFEKSVSEILIDNGMEYLIYNTIETSKDPIHLNDIQPVNFDGNYWKKGDLFLSLRHQSMVLLYRPSTNKIIWKGTGPFFKQHDVDILDNHRISIFNNNTKNKKVDGNSEILIYDFKKKKYSTFLSESLSQNNVRTVTQGLNQILSNGDLFVEEQNSARTLYFNSDGTLRWSHLNRSKNGNLYQVGWSRILYNDEEIQSVNKFLKLRGKCND